MATVKVKFRKSTVEGKTGTVYYQLCHGQSNRQITTRIRIFPDWWNPETGGFVINPDNNETLSRYTHQIEKDLLCIRRVICQLDGEGMDYTIHWLISLPVYVFHIVLISLYRIDK